ncbi:hypothetical protein JCM6882_003964 [Rhodosporidiobolus microsporus]
MSKAAQSITRQVSGASAASTAVSLGPSSPSSSNSPKLVQRPSGPHLKHSYIRSSPESAERTGRTLVLFFDGTGNAFGQSFTNIPTMLSLVSGDPSKVLTYYQTGIGTPLTHDSWGLRQIIRKIGQIVDAGVAYSVGRHICSGYRWLMDSYQPGDSVQILGFSRGAFTARALAGMIQQVGLLPAGNEETIPLAYSIYKNASEEELIPGETVAQGFRRTFSREIYIDFVGVFDTVSSVGALWPRTLPFANRSEYIHRFRQVYSLDERRARFAVQPWIRSKGKEEKTDVREVAMVGSHSQIGGGQYEWDGDYAPNLAHLSLIWMLKEAVEAGLDLDHERIARSPIFEPFYQQALDATLPSATQHPELELYLQKVKNNNPNVNTTVAACVWYASRPNPRATANALAPRADVIGFSIEKRPAEVRAKMSWKDRLGDWWSRRKQQATVLGWWLLEVSPTLKIFWDDEGQIRKWRFKPNLGKGRRLPKDPIFHFSVRERLAAKGALSFGPGNNENVPEGDDYTFAARFKKGQSIADVTWDGDRELDPEEEAKKKAEKAAAKAAKKAAKQAIAQAQGERAPVAQV